MRQVRESVSLGEKGVEKPLGKKKKIGYEVLEKMVGEYFEVYLPQSDEVADIESLADYLGMTRDELMGMMNHKKAGKILKLARNRIAKIKKQLAFRGKIPAAVLSFDLKNNHGYRDKPEESDTTSEQVIFKGKATDWAK